MGQQEQFKYFAFISYNSKDIKWGKKVQKKLEHYRMPATLCSEHGWERKPLKPIFFAPTDIQPGGLTAELQERLKVSRNLIVICSPNSAKSEWVGKEIEDFHSLGRTDNIHFFIVDGIPHSGNEDTECFNPIVETLGLPEILGANVHEKVSPWPWVNKERAYVQLITKLLGVEFDSIWQRHKRMMIEKCISWTIGIIVVLATFLSVWINNQPVDVKVHLNEVSVHNDDLPPLKDAIVTITLENETKNDTIQAFNENALFANVPNSAIGKEVGISVSCKNWIPVDTTLILQNSMDINIARNPSSYGHVQCKLWDANIEKGISGASITIAGISTRTDNEGRFEMNIPLEKQREQYKVSCSIPLENDILIMPTTESSILIVK